MAKNLNGAVFGFSRMAEEEIVFIPGNKLAGWTDFFYNFGEGANSVSEKLVLAEHKNEI